MGRDISERGRIRQRRRQQPAARLCHLARPILWATVTAILMGGSGGSAGRVHGLQSIVKQRSTLARPTMMPAGYRITRDRHRRLRGSQQQQHHEDDDMLHADGLLTAANSYMRATELVGTYWESSSAHTTEPQSSPPESSPLTRRLVFATSLIGAGTALGMDATDAAAVTVAASPNSKLNYVTTPVNKRTGVTVFDAERNGYNVRFVTYLSRFLLSFDADCQRWWYSRAADLPRFGKASEINELRLRQFAAFSASVEVGLQSYRAPDGPKRLLKSLLKRYSPSMDKINAQREKDGLPPLKDEAAKREERECKEARRQLALLFALMEQNQPVDEVTKLLAGIDNGAIDEVEIENHGSGYAPGYGPPQITFPPPEAGDDYETATGRATLRPNGHLLRVDVLNRGFGYSKPPDITIAPPAVIRFADGGANDDIAVASARTAQAKAFIFKTGVNKGRIERIELTDPGAGYSENEIIKIRFAPPSKDKSSGGVTGTARAVLEYEVGSIEVINSGSGYAVEKPITVYVEPPPLTARVNMNDPLMAGIIATDQPLPATSIPSKEMRKKMLDVSDPNSVASKAAFMAVNGGKGGGGGCIGRACYDTAVVARAYPRAEKDSYTAFRDKDEAIRSQNVENAVDIRSAVTAEGMAPRIVSGAGYSGQYASDLLPSFGTPKSSTQLLSLLPAGIGVEYNSEAGRYQLAVDPSFEAGGDSVKTAQEMSTRAFDPDFGPRGRSPIEREMELGLATYLRFVASGAICCSGVHLAVTPIDVVKTKLQTDPKGYPDMVTGFKKVLNDGGFRSFFRGWAPTFAGFFLLGGVTYALTEFLRRWGTELAGINAPSLEVPIIVSASATGAFVGSIVLCPFEAVRIRSVAQPNYGKNIVDVTQRMIREEGWLELFVTVPVFWAKEIPFAMGKFTVFDISTAWMYEKFPAAQEDLQLSLIVSLVGGTLGGMVAAVLSNPADVSISELKKAKSDMTAVQAVQKILDRDGPSGLFRGLPLRFVFYSLVVSLQFLVYDAVRLALGIGSDDLKLYLDVLGGALSESGGPV